MLRDGSRLLSGRFEIQTFQRIGDNECYVIAYAKSKLVEVANGAS